MFSIFEDYTEWINKGKTHPSFELGKNTVITTDQFNLILDHYVMENESDSETVMSIYERITEKFTVDSWSFDRGFFSKDNKLKLMLKIPKVIMPKKGKKNKSETEEENSLIFKRLRNKHSAIESNINELEHRGLDRCPDRGYEKFKRYVALAVCAYNLKRIGQKLLDQKLEEKTRPHKTRKIAA